MTKERTIPTLRNRHRREERALMLSALESSGWVLTQAANALRIRPSSLERLLDKHELREQYRARNPGKTGRKPAESRG